MAVSADLVPGPDGEPRLAAVADGHAKAEAVASAEAAIRALEAVPANAEHAALAA